MRLARLALAALAPGVLAAPAAQAQVGAAPLAQGEVLLQVGGIGSTTAPADLATFTVTVTGEGPTDAAARADLEARSLRLVAALREAGVPAAGISRSAATQGVPLRLFDVREEPPPPPDEPVPSAEPPSQPAPPPSAAVTLSGTVTVRFTDVRRVSAVDAAIAGSGGGEPGYGRPVFTLTDDRAARQRAREQALASARADAEAYAAPLGLRVVRMVRVTERTGLELFPRLFGDDPVLLRQAFSGPHRDPEIPVFVLVGIDFVLAPR